MEPLMAKVNLRVLAASRIRQYAIVALQHDFLSCPVLHFGTVLEEEANMHGSLSESNMAVTCAGKYAEADVLFVRAIVLRGSAYRSVIYGLRFYWRFVIFLWGIWFATRRNRNCSGGLQCAITECPNVCKKSLA